MPRVLPTGATGYVGGRLLRELERRGVKPRCFVRRPEALAGIALASTEIVSGDAADPEAARRAMAGVEAVESYPLHRFVFARMLRGIAAAAAGGSIQP